MQTLKLLIITSFVIIKSMILCALILSNKSLMEEATKCLFRTSLSLTHSTRMKLPATGMYPRITKLIFGVRVSETQTWGRGSRTACRYKK